MGDKLIINGGKRLSGTVSVSGAKNAAVAIIPAALLCDETCVIDNLPYIDDVKVLATILEQLGAKVDLTKSGKMTINPKGANSYRAPQDMVSKMRASYYLMGVLLGRFGRAEVAMPGGCYIGARPIDQHIKGFKAMGVTVEEKGVFYLEAAHLHGAEIYLDMASVGATINIILAAVKADGNTTIVNAAKEPHVVDLANFLNNMGASIKGAGTDTIKIKGVKYLRGCQYTIIPDQIETGTFMIIAAATKSDLTISNCIPVHMEAVTAKLMETGVEVTEGDDYINVSMRYRPKAVNIKTMGYPGFPTDLQQPLSAMMTISEGTSLITESIFEARYRHLEEMRRMGAKVRTEDRVAVIDGVPQIYGASVAAQDLRGGAALIVAALMAEGSTTISGVKYIDRGYERIVDKLKSLGADITRVKG